MPVNIQGPCQELLPGEHHLLMFKGPVMDFT